MSINICHFMGNLVADPELRTTSGGSKVVNFRIAVNRYFKKNGESQKDTSFLDMEAWDTGAERINQYFKKGDSIIVHCEVKTDSWEKDGEKRSKLRFRVNQFAFPGRRKSENGNGNGNSHVANEETTETVEAGVEIPF